MAFLSVALAVTLSLACATSYASSVYETHADIYASLTQRAQVVQGSNGRARQARHLQPSKNALPKSAPVALSVAPVARQGPVRD